MSVIFQRIKELCEREGITISKLEHQLGFSGSTIKKWESTASPTAERLVKTANYFNVSADYLLGLSDLEINIGDPGFSEKERQDFVTFSRGFKKMTTEDRSRMILVLKLAFSDIFSQDVPPQE